MKAKTFILAVLILLSVAFIFTGCGEKETKKGGTFIIELYPEYAPATVENFIKLVENGFYEGLVFHRISDGFMAQGGGFSPPGIIGGEKKPADSIFGEFASNGFSQNTLKHTRGVISMARTDNMNSASSEFFIMYDTATHLDGDYAAFGKVIDGMEVIDKFMEVELKAGFSTDRGKATIPVESIIIKKATLLENNGGGNPKVQMEVEY